MRRRIHEVVCRSAACVSFNLGNGTDSPDNKATMLYVAVEHIFKFSGGNNTRKFLAMWWKSDALFGPFFEEQLSMCRRARIKKQK
jgi:hypothetical protein